MSSEVGKVRTVSELLSLTARVEEGERNSRRDKTVQVGGRSKPTLNCKFVMLGLSPVGRGEPLTKLVEK